MCETWNCAKSLAAKRLVRLDPECIFEGLCSGPAECRQVQALFPQEFTSSERTSLQGTHQLQRFQSRQSASSSR